jgi:hypothetical protein
LASDELVNKKIKKIYTLEDLHKKYNSDGQYSFPPDLEKNFQKNLTFEITEYATLIF